MIADAFVFVFAPFESLCQLRDWGMLERESALLGAVSARYRRVVVMTYGSSADRELVGLLPPNCELVCNEQGLDTAEYLGTVPERVAALLDGIGSAVVRTHQMWHGDVAVNIATRLRGKHVRTGLIARCGYVWSQFVAKSQGPEAARTVEARQVEGEVCRAADVVIATTQRMLDDLCWAHGVASSRTRLIANFVPDDRPVVMEADRDPREILYAGRFTAQKRLDLLIDAVALLPRSLGARLRLIGNGELEASLRARAEHTEISCAFEPRKPHGEMLDAMARCGVYAQTSAYEGHPRTVIEAMSTGAPTLITDTDGQGPEVVDGVTGVKVSMDPASIAAGLERLLRDRATGQRLGETGARSVRARYGFSVLLEREYEAQRESLEIAGAGARPVAGGVRFGHPLLHADADEAFRSWQRGLECFVRRMQPGERGAFLEAMGREIDRMAVDPPEPTEPESGHTDLCAV